MFKSTMSLHFPASHTSLSPLLMMKNKKTFSAYFYKSIKQLVHTKYAIYSTKAKCMACHKNAHGRMCVCVCVFVCFNQVMRESVNYIFLNVYSKNEKDIDCYRTYDNSFQPKYNGIS